MQEECPARQDVQLSRAGEAIPLRQGLWPAHGHRAQEHLRDADAPGHGPRQFMHRFHCRQSCIRPLIFLDTLIFYLDLDHFRNIDR